MATNTMVRLDEGCENFGKDNGLIHEAVITGRKVGAGQNFWAKLAHDEELFGKVVAFVERGGVIAHVPAMIANYKPTSSQVRAREIMGKNYLGIEEVFHYFGATYTEEQIVSLAEIPFSESVLEECRYTHVLVAGFPMTILDIRAKARSKKYKIFYSYKDAWYENQAFAKCDRVEIRWYLIRKQMDPTSTFKAYNEQKALLAKHEELPRACEFVYAVVLYFMATQERLLSSSYVRVSSLDSNGDPVQIGHFDSDGLCIGSNFGYHHNMTGIASGWKSSVED